MYGARLARWDHAAEWPLTVAAVLFLIAYATQILARDAGVWSAAAEVVLWVTWALFAIDYVVRLTITENRRSWFFRHLLDLAIVVLPMLRPLRLMRFLTILAIIQRGAGSMLRGRVVVYTVGATALVILIAGLAVLDAEQGQGGSIQNLGDAIWWAFVTITTVGYGDYFPVTVTGRIVAVGLMVGGIALIGVVTATLASWIVERVSNETTDKAATTSQVEQLRAEVAELKQMISELRLSR
jgi:voltage-gated potassium channel